MRRITASSAENARSGADGAAIGSRGFSPPTEVRIFDRVMSKPAPRSPHSFGRGFAPGSDLRPKRMVEDRSAVRSRNPGNMSAAPLFSGGLALRSGDLLLVEEDAAR